MARLLRDATIVSPESSMLYTPLLPEVAAGALEPRHAYVPLRKMCPDAELLRGRVSALDQAARTVTVETEIGEVQVSYRRLVIALGSTARMLPIPGLADHAMTFKDLTDAIRLRNHVIRQLDLAEADPRNASRHLTFVFVGAGYAGVEAFAEMRQLVEDALPHYPALRGMRQRWVLVDAGPGILAEVPPQLADHTTAQLRRHGVEILTSTTVASVEASAVTLGDGRRLATGTLVWTAGVVTNPLVRTLGLPLDPRGRIVVDSRCGSVGTRTSGRSGTVPPCRTPPRPVGSIRPPASTPCARRGRVAASLGGATRRTRTAASAKAPRSDVARESLGSSVCTCAVGWVPWSPGLPHQRGPGAVPATAHPRRRGAVGRPPTRHRRARHPGGQADESWGVASATHAPARRSCSGRSHAAGKSPARRVTGFSR